MRVNCGLRINWIDGPNHFFLSGNKHDDLSIFGQGTKFCTPQIAQVEMIILLKFTLKLINLPGLQREKKNVMPFTKKLYLRKWRQQVKMAKKQSTALSKTPHKMVNEKEKAMHISEGHRQTRPSDNSFSCYIWSI